MATTACMEKSDDSRSSGRIKSDLENLQPAEQNIVAIFQPYFQGKKRDILPFAITLYKQGNLEGERQIIGGDSIPFVASWSTSGCFIPAALTRCRVQFDGNPDLSYEIIIPNYQLVGYLIEVIVNYKLVGSVDFTKLFYCKLLQRNN